MAFHGANNNINNKNPRSLNKISYYNVNNNNHNNSLSYLHKGSQMHGVKRVLVFCLTTAILPTALIITPLYLRNVVFADVTYPVAESDILAIDNGISSIFCQSQTLQMNSSFNAYQINGVPQVNTKKKHIRLKKSMILPDDTLEYWGFYLLKDAVVNLKVCSRYDGSRILVVRGDKDLKTCGLLDHNMKKFGAKLDMDHNQVKVTFENAAEIGLVDHQSLDFNNAAEDTSIDNENVNLTIKKRIEKGQKRLKQSKSEPTTVKILKNRKRRQTINNKKVQVEKLKAILESEDEKTIFKRRRRSIGNLDAHIKHGGNAMNYTRSSEDQSVSSFEMDLLTCYDGQILLTKDFPPSQHCNDVHYLEKSKHMVATHEVASDGYYYYIFYSDNDNFKNDIHAIFDIYKPTYRFANSSMGKECLNQTECQFDISFFSNANIIVEVPTRDGIEHEADDITLLVSKCHPRMAIYMIFPIAVLFLILGCAFL